MAFLLPIIKKNYSNIYLQMVIHINSSKYPICLIPCRLKTIYILIFLDMTYFIHNRFSPSLLLTEECHRKHQ